MGTVVVAAVLFLEQNFPIGRTGATCKDPLWFVIFFSHAVATKSLVLFGFLGLISSAYFHYSAVLKVAQRFGIGWGLYFRLTQITFYITSAFVVAAAVYDLVKGIRRDTPHWIGIAGWLVGSLVADLLLQIARLVLSTSDLYGI